MHSRKQNLAEAMVNQVAMVMQVEGVPEVAAHNPKVDIVSSALTDEANVPIVEHPINQGNAQPMVKPATTVVREVTMPDTAIQHSIHPLQGDIHTCEYLYMYKWVVAVVVIYSEHVLMSSFQTLLNKAK